MANLPKSSDVAVVGGGVAGCAAAYELARAGVAVTLIEGDRIGAYASGNAAGGLNPLEGRGIPDPLGPLAMASFCLHRELSDQLQEESNVDFQPQRVSRLQVIFDESQRTELDVVHKTFKAADGFAADWVSAVTLRQMEPRVAPQAIGALWVGGNFAVNSCLYTRALSKAAQGYGARICIGRVRSLKGERSTATSVVLENGEIACGAVVIATGPWSGVAKPWLRVAIPVEPCKGEMLRMRIDPPLSHELSSASVNLFKRLDGLTWIGATEQRRGFDLEPSQWGRRTLLHEAAELLPEISNARIVKHTACLRPVSADGLPIIGPVHPWGNVYVLSGAGKKGILLAPAMGKAMAEMITIGHTALPVAAFGMERFGGQGQISNEAGRMP